MVHSNKIYGQHLMKNVPSRIVKYTGIVIIMFTFKLEKLQSNLTHITISDHNNLLNKLCELMLSLGILHLYSSIKIQRIGLVQNGRHYHLTECNLFSP